MPKTRYTSSDVARLAGVSRTTVSFVLNNVPGIHISEETRKRVLEVTHQLNYHPNAIGRKLVSGKSNAIGLVLRQSPEQIFADAALLRVMLGIEHAVTLEGYEVLLKPVPPDDSSGYIRLINENHVDGIILSGPRHDDTEILALHRQGVPIMLMGQLPGSGIPFVDIDTVASSKAAVRHLIDQGHCKIALITNAPLNYTSAQQRHAGFLQALQDAGIAFQDSWLQEGNYTPASGFTAMTKLLEQAQHPTAVFIASDVVAMGAIQAIKGAGLRTPQDIAVVGFDDIPIAEYYDPPLTTMHLPAYELGWAAGERLIRVMREEGLGEAGFLLEAGLVVRKSSVR